MFELWFIFQILLHNIFHNLKIASSGEIYFFWLYCLVSILTCIFRFCDHRAFLLYFLEDLDLYLEELPIEKVSDLLENDGASSGFINKP